MYDSPKQGECRVRSLSINQTFMNMKRIIEDTGDLVFNGAKFYIDLEKRSLSVNGQYFIKDGKIQLKHADLGCWHKEDWPEEKLFWALELRYRDYKHSVPSERSESHRRSYFKALPEKELSDEDMLYGESREFARYELESFLLAMIMCGAFKWKEEWGSWFWQSPKDPDFVILRKWIEPAEE